MTVPSTGSEIDAAPRGCWTTGHWLRHCEGYRVWEATGPVGYVEAVLLTEEHELHSLVVRAGSSRSVLVTYPVDAVEGLDPASEQVFVGAVGGARREPRRVDFLFPAR